MCIRDRQGEPRQKPPFPFQSGLFGKPTIINNVETLATVPAIMLQGADWFRQFGTEKSPGTKVFALSGNIVNTGLVEVPMEMCIRDSLQEKRTAMEEAETATQTASLSAGKAQARWASARQEAERQGKALFGEVSFPTISQQMNAAAAECQGEAAQLDQLEMQLRQHRRRCV